jgi:hypothetical protein
MNPVILDCGNAVIKVVNSSTEVSFPHAIVEISEQDWRKATSRAGEPHEDYIKVNGIPYVVGSRAERHGIPERKTGASRYNELYYGVLMAAALTRIYKKSMRDIFLFGSHAPGDVDYRADLMQAAVGKWEIENLGREMAFEVFDAATFDEPLGGLMNVLLTQKGIAYKNAEMNKGVTLVIDIGGFTTDGLVIDPGGEVDYSTAQSSRVGILDAIQQFKDDFKSNHRLLLKDMKKWREDSVREAFRTGKINLGGLGILDCQEEINQACSKIVNRILDIYQGYGGSTQYDYVVLTGGGSALLEVRLRAALNHHAIYLSEDDPADIHMANARGGMKFFRLHEAIGTWG